MKLTKFLDKVGMELAINSRMRVTGTGPSPVKNPYYCVVASGILDAVATHDNKEEGVFEGVGRAITGNGRTPAEALANWCVRIANYGCSREYSVMFNYEQIVVPKQLEVDFEI